MAVGKWFTLLVRQAAVFLVPFLLAADVPNDPDFDLQWGLSNTGQVVDGLAGMIGADVDALAGWDIHRGSSSVIVAIVGDGVNPHPEFSGRLLEGYATVGDPFNTLDECHEGTHLAGVIAASSNNGAGIAGLNGSAWILPVRVLDGCAGTEPATALGIIWAVDHGADIVLVPLQFGDGSAVLADAVAYAAANDVLLIAPAGHAGDPEVMFPAAFAECLAVSATTNQDALTDDSNYGVEIDLAGPGLNIWSTWHDGGYSYLGPARDTVAAAAFVAGVAALVRSYAPQLSASEVAQVLIDSAVDLDPPGRDIFFGAGRVTARGALELATPPALRFEHLEPLPATLPPGRIESFVVRIADGVESVAIDAAELFFRVDSADFQGTLLTPLGTPGLFRVDIPALTCESSVEYFLLARGDGGTMVTDPLDAPAELHFARAIVWRETFADDFEIDTGWQVEGGDGTSGRWSRVSPIGTSAQPGYDFSRNAGTLCYVTGQHFGGHDGTNDVDGGPVQLTSPEIVLGASDYEVSYARWFYWNGLETEDFLTVEMSRDGGKSWVTVETVSSTGLWVPHSFRLSEFPQATGDQLRVRFSTEDIPSDSLTEAAIDEFRVLELDCSATWGDTNDDEIIDLLDHRYLIDCWSGPDVATEGQSCDVVDFDVNHRVDLYDFGEFQKVFAPQER